MEFASASDFLTGKNIFKELENLIKKSIGDDQFIKDACTPMFKGGKRLRPILFLLCSNVKEKIPQEKILPLAVALELIHTASLVHDDILDGAKRRRGVETANAKYGTQISVLVGDYLFAKAFQLVAEGNYGSNVSRTLSELVKNLCIGEITQDRALFVIPSMSEYYNRINLKTAFFLSTCCKLGGMVGGLDSDDVKNLADYGTSLGLAFQITDDLLDFFGDENLTGKQIGGDLKSGVITLPVIRALEVGESADVLKKIVTDKAVTNSDIKTAIEIIQKTDAVEYCRLRAEAHIDCARINLPSSIKNSVRVALEQIADFVVTRKK